MTNYALLRRDLEALQKFAFRAIILDEAQFIKNPGAQVTQSVKQLKSEYRLALTGTPLASSSSGSTSVASTRSTGGSYTAVRPVPRPAGRPDDPGARLRRGAATIEDAYEPYLLREGLPCARRGASRHRRAYAHLGSRRAARVAPEREAASE